MANQYRAQLDALMNEFKVCQKALVAVGDETRQHIICVMLEKSGETGMRVIDIAKYTNLSRPAVSHHMQIMKDSGIMKSYKKETMIFYYLDPDSTVIQTMASLMRHITELTSRIECSPEEANGL